MSKRELQSAGDLKRIDSTDALLDASTLIITTMSAGKARDRRMKAAHAEGSDACEICGRPVTATATTIVGSRVGPECTKKLQKLGYIWD